MDNQHKTLAEQFSGYGDPPNDPAMALVFAVLYVGEMLDRIANAIEEAHA